MSGVGDWLVCWQFLYVFLYNVFDFDVMFLILLLIQFATQFVAYGGGCLYK
jgi:hypothetical protein